MKAITSRVADLAEDWMNEANHYRREMHAARKRGDVRSEADFAKLYVSTYERADAVRQCLTDFGK